MTGPGLKRSDAVQPASVDWDAQAADAVARERAWEWEDQTAAARLTPEARPCPYGCANGHDSQYDYDETHHNPEGGARD